MDVLLGGLGISKLQFLIKKKKKISAVFFSTSIFVIKPLDPDSLEMLDPDPDSLNRYCIELNRIFYLFLFHILMSCKDVCSATLSRPLEFISYEIFGNGVYDLPFNLTQHIFLCAVFGSKTFFI